MATLQIPLATDHPAFAGHFPGRPIVPGVVLLDQAILLIEAAETARVKSIAIAKFLSPAGPGEALWLDYTRADTALRFEIRSDERKIATGRMELA